MKNFTITPILLAMSLGLSATSYAASVSKEQYTASGKGIDAAYSDAKAACASLAGNAKDICRVDAKGKKNVAWAELESSYKPSVNTSYKVKMARADADYALANEKCDDKAGNDKSVCRKEAKDIRVHAVADAKLRMKTVEARTDAMNTTGDANVKASDKIAAAKKDANSDKRDADYALAKAKCDVLAGAAKDVCIADAKARTGQN